MNQQLEIMDAKPQQVQAVNQPVDMLQYAISQNAPIETIERLVALQEQARQREAKAAFDNAMSIAQPQIPVIMKTKKVAFGNTKYAHEDLAEINTVLKPILSPLGLSYTWNTDVSDSIVSVTCVVAHKDGYSTNTNLKAPVDTSGQKNSIQAIGSTITYLQRYTLRAAFGLAVANDDDARFAEKPDEPVITESQVVRIRELLDETNSNIENFCKWAKVNALIEIKAKDYPTIEARLIRIKKDAK